MADDRIAFNGRPSSTIVQNFADDLDAMFGLDKLSQTVEAKKHTVSTVEQELQELEARLRETEQRLARVSRTSSPSRAPPRPPPAAPTGLNPSEHTSTVPRSSPLAQRPTYPADRPPTQGGRDDQPAFNHNQHPMPKHLPPEPPNGGSSEYVMVDRNPQHSTAQRGY